MTPSDYPLLGSSQAALPSLQSAPAIHQRGTQHTQPQPAYGDPYSSQTRAAPSGLQGPPTRSYDSTPFGPPSLLPHPPSSHPQATSVQRATASDLLKPIGTGLNSPSAYQPPLQSNSVASPRFIPAEQQRPPASQSVPPLNSASIPRTDFAQPSTSQQALLSPPSSAQPNRSTLLPQHQTRNSYSSSYQADPQSQALGSASLSPQQQPPSHYTGGQYGQPQLQWPTSQPPPPVTQHGTRNAYGSQSASQGPGFMDTAGLQSYNGQAQYQPRAAQSGSGRRGSKKYVPFDVQGGR
ncbi:hypothetical protein LTR15_002850 [Elasticomyces elasticus]|nr:hypothetical protein LTR15_002850 [Elasticomyces elasticus]